MARSTAVLLVALLAVGVALAAASGSNLRATFAAASKCSADLVRAGEDLGAAAGYIGHAVTDCKDGNSTGCALDIEDVISEVDDATEAVTSAVTDCGGSSNTQCADTLESLVNTLDNASQDATKALTNCKAKNIACVLEVVGIAVDLGEIVKDIASAVKDCRA